VQSSRSLRSLDVADATPLPQALGCVMALSEKQRGVLKGVLTALTISICAIVGSIVVGPEILSVESSVAERIAFAFKTDIFLAAWLGLSIALLARHRFFTPEDIDGGGLTRGTTKASILQVTLQNTLEQTVLAVLAHAAWAVVMPVEWISTVPVAALMFVVGRVLFMKGYEGGAPSRALGFALTFYPSVIMIIIILMRVLGALVR
jgi:hypothetical protein